MFHYNEPLDNTKGQALTGFYVRCVDAISGNSATLYADENLTPILSVSGLANAAQADDDGMVDFYVVEGTYHLDIYAPDGTTFIKRFRNRPMVLDIFSTTLRNDLAATGGFALVNTSFAAPAFTNTAYHSSAPYIVNGASPGSLYSSLQVGANATEALTAAVIVPASATNHQTNAGGFYIRSDRAQVGNGGDVALYSQAQTNANSSAAFAMNLLNADTAGKTGQILSNEIDTNIFATDTVATGVNVVLSDSVGGAGVRNGIRLDKAGTYGWLNGLVTVDGAISASGYALLIGSVTTTTLTNRDSQPIALVSYKSDNTRYIGTILGDHTGGIAVRPGNALGSVAFQPPDGSVNWAYVNSAGLNLGVGLVLSMNGTTVIDASRNASFVSSAIGGGTPLTKVVVYAPSITPASVGAATVAEQTFTVSGLTTADKVIVNPPAIANATGIVGARVSAADTLALRFVNPTGGALTPSSGTYTIVALRS